MILREESGEKRVEGGGRARLIGTPVLPKRLVPQLAKCSAYIIQGQICTEDKRKNEQIEGSCSGLFTGKEKL